MNNVKLSISDYRPSPSPRPGPSRHVLTTLDHQIAEGWLMSCALTLDRTQFSRCVNLLQQLNIFTNGSLKDWVNLTHKLIWSNWHPPCPRGCGLVYLLNSCQSKPYREKSPILLYILWIFFFIFRPMSSSWFGKSIGQSLFWWVFCRCLGESLYLHQAGYLVNKPFFHTCVTKGKKVATSTVG